MAVIIVAGLIGTFVPLFLDKRGIDPAIATGPFITTSNDIFGILIYFMIAKNYSRNIKVTVFFEINPIEPLHNSQKYLKECLVPF